MAKHEYRTCDRCKKQIGGRDDRLQDQLDREYSGKDICPICDLDIKLAQAIAKSASISNQSLQEAAEQWLSLYD